MYPYIFKIKKKSGQISSKHENVRESFDYKIEILSQNTINERKLPRLRGGTNHSLNSSGDNAATFVPSPSSCIITSDSGSRSLIGPQPPRFLIYCFS